MRKTPKIIRAPLSGNWVLDYEGIGIYGKSLSEIKDIASYIRWKIRTHQYPTFKDFDIFTVCVREGGGYQI